MEQDHLSVQIPGVLHAGHHLVRVLGAPVLRVDGPSDDAPAGGGLQRLVHGAIGRPQQRGRGAQHLLKQRVRRGLIRLLGGLIHLAQVCVAVRVAADLAAHVRRPADCLRRLGEIPRHFEEGSHRAVLLQNIQDLVRVDRVGTIVKGQGHHGARGIHHPLGLRQRLHGSSAALFRGGLRSILPACLLAVREELRHLAGSGENLSRGRL